MVLITVVGGYSCICLSILWASYQEPGVRRCCNLLLPEVHIFTLGVFFKWHKPYKTVIRKNICFRKSLKISSSMYMQTFPVKRLWGKAREKYKYSCVMRWRISFLLLKEFPEAHKAQCTKGINIEKAWNNKKNETVCSYFHTQDFLI